MFTIPAAAIREMGFERRNFIVDYSGTGKIMGLKPNTKEFDQLVDKISVQLKSGLSKGIAKAMDHIGIISAGKYWIKPGGEGRPSNPSKLTVRTGRGIRSLLPQGGAFASGEREQVRTVHAKGDRIIGEFGTVVPYLLFHEKTGVKRTFVPTVKQRKFFWAKFYESGKVEDKWKASALARVINVSFGPRPFLGPAVDSSLDRIFGIMEESLGDVIG